MRLVKIVATVGPRTNSKAGIGNLVDAGVNVFRLNGSHSDLEWHKNAVEVIRSVTLESPILLDIPGSKIRTRDLGGGTRLSVGQSVVFGLREPRFEWVTPTTMSAIPTDIEKGHTIYADDGTLEFRVTDVSSEEITCESLTEGLLKTAKGINFPNSKISDGELSRRDKVLLSFAASNQIDFVGISFVHSASQIARVRELLGEASTSVLAKIEDKTGFDNREEVISAADAIMIDRGDLAAETGKFEVAVRQSVIVRECVRLSKPVIVATEMLHSMLTLPYPTKSEISDITNAVLQGASATMLSGETAVGDFPFEAVTTMSETILATERSLAPLKESVKAFPNAILDAAATLIAASGVEKCLVFTRTGYAARKMSSSLPGVEILAISDEKNAARALNLLRGVRGIVSSQPFRRDSADFINVEVHRLLKEGILTEGERLLVTGLIFPKSGDRQNFLFLTEASSRTGGST